MSVCCVIPQIVCSKYIQYISRHYSRDALPTAKFLGEPIRERWNSSFPDQNTHGSGKKHHHPGTQKPGQAENHKEIYRILSSSIQYHCIQSPDQKRNRRSQNGTSEGSKNEPARGSKTEPTKETLKTNRKKYYR